jgi:biopolymer transport protein TolR
MTGPSQGGGAMSDINVTPLVDVMLVLLIIFMVTAPMMQESAGVKVELPRSEAPPLDPADEEQLVLAIDADRHVWIGENDIPVAELDAKLAAIAKANPELDVFLRADGDVPYKEVAALLGIAKKAGMPRVGLVFEPGVGELSGGAKE